MKLSQSRLESFVEAVINVLIGWGVALLSQLVIFPMNDIHVEIKTNLIISIWFTVVSVIRSYAVRRWFNARLHRAAQLITTFGWEEDGSTSK